MQGSQPFCLGHENGKRLASQRQTVRGHVQCVVLISQLEISLPLDSIGWNQRWINDHCSVWLIHAIIRKTATQDAAYDQNHHFALQVT